MDWIEPKITWHAATDHFNIEDFNRIKNNLNYLYCTTVILLGDIEIVDMGEDITTYDGFWNVSVFNAFETNLEALNNKVLGANIGVKKVFYENGPFIDCEELNRIEEATLLLKNALDNLSVGIRKIPFALGRFKEMRI